MPTEPLLSAVTAALDRRVTPIERLADAADAVAASCLALARAFRTGGRILTFGAGTSATEAHHVSVECVHPVIGGKRALPAFSLAADSATVTGVAEAVGPHAMFAHQLQVLGRSGDIALGICGDGDSPSVVRALVEARRRGLLTVALTGGDGGRIARQRLADHCLTVDSADPRVVKEGQVTLYHLLWELTHAFLEQPHVLDHADDRRANPDPGLHANTATDTAAGIAGLYPFLYTDTASLAEPTAALTALTTEVAASARAKISEVVRLRREVGQSATERLADCADRLAQAFRQGGTLLAFGNGGSSSDAQDVVHTFLDPGAPASMSPDPTIATATATAPATPPTAATNPTPLPPPHPLPALCLTNDTAVVTALSNDIGFDAVFARQLQAVARPGDIALAVSTSGGSANVLAALAAARKSGLVTVGFAGYGGGRMAEPGCVDHLFAIPSDSVHRVQEVQTTLYHVLWEAVQTALSRPAPDPGPRTPRPGPD